MRSYSEHAQGHVSVEESKSLLFRRDTKIIKAYVVNSIGESWTFIRLESAKNWHTLSQTRRHTVMGNRFQSTELIKASIRRKISISLTDLITLAIVKAFLEFSLPCVHTRITWNAIEDTAHLPATISPRFIVNPSFLIWHFWTLVSRTRS